MENGPSRGVTHLNQQSGNAKHHAQSDRQEDAGNDERQDKTRRGLVGGAWSASTSFPNFADRQGRCQGGGRRLDGNWVVKCTSGRKPLWRLNPPTT